MNPKFSVGNQWDHIWSHSFPANVIELVNFESHLSSTKPPIKQNDYINRDDAPPMIFTKTELTENRQVWAGIRMHNYTGTIPWQVVFSASYLLRGLHVRFAIEDHNEPALIH